MLVTSTLLIHGPLTTLTFLYQETTFYLPENNFSFSKLGMKNWDKTYHSTKHELHVKVGIGILS